ncbi:BFD-like [2Fe-2S] binding domain-containing protein [Brevinema andersonii]|uniref:BFD-like [2Fe-2S] binding domain-containing protein n=1 Tax=Brevinema andersonii TaxID=34097 RepID=A0A1I1EIH3_BREAD|nr:(2Fe-2S)-binding protein [Brevinema andersonii]SFB84753.1 BFD-like [2Fe-2S] binding domain-containing protein [Brevinema andersonii]
MADKDHVVCTCLGTTLGELQDVIDANPGITVEELMEKTSAGTICGMCIDGSNGEEISLNSLIEEANKK